MTLFHINSSVSFNLFLLFIFGFGYFRVTKPNLRAPLPQSSDPLPFPMPWVPPSDTLVVLGVILAPEITWLHPLCFRVFASVSPCPRR